MPNLLKLRVDDPKAKELAQKPLSTLVPQPPTEPRLRQSIVSSAGYNPYH